MFLKAFKPQLWWPGGDLSCYCLWKSLLWELTVLVLQLIQRWMKENVEGYWVKLKLEVLPAETAVVGKNFSQFFPPTIFASFLLKKTPTFNIWRVICSHRLWVQWHLSSWVLPPFVLSLSGDSSLPLQGLFALPHLEPSPIWRCGRKHHGHSLVCLHTRDPNSPLPEDSCVVSLFILWRLVMDVGNEDSWALSQFCILAVV